METAVKDESQLCVRGMIISGSQDPDAPAIESPGLEPLTYRDLREQIACVVRSLNEQGFRPNDRIAVVMPNGPETAVAILAVMAGFTVVPLNHQMKETDFSDFYSFLGIRAVVVRDRDTPAAVAAGMQKIPVFTVRCSGKTAGTFTLTPGSSTTGTSPRYAEPSDLAAIKLTAGTTGRPKAIPLTQARFFRGVGILNEKAGITSRDRNLHFLPLDTGFGFETALGGTLLTGGTLVCLREFVPSDFIQALSAWKPTYFWGGPAHHHAIVQELKKDPRPWPGNHTLRLIISGSAAMNPAVHQELEERLGVRVIDIYVMSEAYIAMNVPYKRGSVGIPFISELEIRDDENHPLRQGEVGEIVVRGDLAISGYLDSPEENAAAFAGGWLRTGDTGYLDDEGYLFLTGRKKEIINKGGRKISPVEIDAVMISHPAVADAMAFRIADPVLGDDIAAAVVKKDGALVAEEDLIRFCVDRLVPFKVPRRIFFTGSIPKNTLGKPLREKGTEIMQSVIGTSGRPAANSTDNSTGLTPVEKRLQKIWEEILDLPAISPDDDFFRCGGNSLTAIELLIRIQREYHTNFPPDTVYRYPTIRQLASLIAEKERKAPVYHPLVVPIREGGSLRPLFCIHALGGWVDHYTMLAPFIDPARPVFGIRARGLEPEETTPLTVEETAGELVEALRSVRRNGPYLIAGFSNGGILAFELACQLTERGESVDFLGIIDQSAPATEVRYLKTLAARLFPGRILGKIPAFFESRLKANPDSGLYYLVSKTAQTVFNKVLSRPGTKSLPPEVSDAQFSANFDENLLKPYPEASHAHMKTQLKASQTYLPRKYSGDVFLFSTGPDPVLFPRDETRGWGSCTLRNVTVVAVPGNHSTLFDEPNLGILGMRFNESLSKADDHGE
ncbi:MULTISPECIES: AMP-binding protein [unclassified Methanoregula]|uniref:AMP-binding protein n=1 Tax=unclassified Methanoregula TaxID=2649730 RepID=UPI0009CFC66B|nr:MULTISPECIES: AMP-binding protein [unclassified Methanoregula]OPX64926.1 MAG: Acetyl-coenzyme A synthetase [Methanoregula sp. PtaB.Bin085]OPY32978.1 MAG: Acetyl-coenzyme A synthetase [Methanoregula sp. PtaU1.Bin006]